MHRTLTALALLALSLCVPVLGKEPVAPEPVPDNPQVPPLPQVQPKKNGIWNNLVPTKVDYRRAEISDTEVLHYVEITLNHKLEEAEGYKAEVSCWVLRGDAEVARGCKDGMIRYLWSALPGEEFPEDLHLNINFTAHDMEPGRNAPDYQHATLAVKVGPPGAFEAAQAPLRDLAAMQVQGRLLQGSLLHRRAQDRLREKAGFDRATAVPERFGRMSARPDLMSAFTAALAVEESLQMGSIEGEGSLEDPQTLDGAALKGPTIQSHPWTQMNLGKKDQPSVGGEFAAWCPADHFYAEARDLEGLLRLQGKLEGWTGPLRALSGLAGKDAHLRERLLGRVGLGSSEMAKTFGPQVIGETALIASDFFFFEGTSLALALKLKEPSALTTYLQFRNGAGEVVEVGGKAATVFRKGTPGAFWLVEEQSVALLASHESLLQSILAARASGTTLAKAADHEYIRRLQPRTDKELAFVYFSDEALRKWLSPRWKILERRRLMALMRMTDENLGVLLGETPSAPKPGSFVTGGALKAVYGEPWSMTPVQDLHFDKITQMESQAYQRFLSDYSSYWSKYFDPIGIQVLEEGATLRVKTVVLPLIEDGYYDEAQKMLSGLEPQAAPGRAEGELFSVTARIPKKELLKPVMLMGNSPEGGRAFQALTGDVNLRIFDGEPLVYFDATQMGQLGGGLDNMVGIGGFVSFLTMPSSIELRHTDEKAVKKLVAQLPEMLRRMDSDFGQLRHARILRRCGEVDVYALSTFGITLRWYFWVTPTHVVISNRPEVLDAVAAASLEGAGAKGHLHLSWSPSQMQRLRMMMNLGRAEAGHHACWTAQAERALAARLNIKAEDIAKVQGCERVCPEGETLEAGKPCRLHGAALEVPLIEVGDSASPLPDVRVHLTLTEEGLWSEMEIEGK